MLSAAPQAATDDGDAASAAWCTACHLAFEGLVRNAPKNVVAHLSVGAAPSDETIRDLISQRRDGAPLVIGYATGNGGAPDTAFRARLTGLVGEPDRWLEAIRVQGVAPVNASLNALIETRDGGPPALLVGIWGPLDGDLCAGLVAGDGGIATDAPEVQTLRAEIARLDLALAEERRETLNLRQRLAALEEPQWQRAETVKAIAREVWDEGRRRTVGYAIGKWFRSRGRRS